MRNRNLITAATVAVISTGMIFASAAVKAVLSAKHLPHRYWYLAQPGHFWTGAIMGMLVRISYLAIALALWWMANYFRRLPRLRPYKWSLVSFSFFIGTWAAVRLMETATIWWPAYRLLIGVEVVCGVVSIATTAIVTAQIPTIATTLRRFFNRLSKEQRQVHALRRGKELLDRAGSLVGVGGWEIDLASGKLTWSAETYRILGAARDYKPVLEEALAFYPVEARSALTAGIELASSGGPGWDMELPTLRFDGRQIWVRVVGGAEFCDGKPVRLTGAFQDITNRIEERLALRRSNERVILAADSGGIGIWDWDIINNEFVCDAWMYRIHGLEFGDGPAPMEFWTENLHPNDRAAVLQALNDAVEGRKPYDTSFRVIRHDGTVRRLKATGHVTRNDAGRAIRMVGTNRDVTESHKLIADLAEQHELLRVTLQSISEGVVTKDALRKVVWMNAVAERLTGWTAAEAVGRPITEIFTAINEKTRIAEDGYATLFPIVGNTAISREPRLLISRDGSECIIEGSANPLRNAHGELLGSVLVFRDVTEQRNLALETQHVRTLQLDLKLKDEFLSHVSHELRSPLTSIYSFTSIIADELAGETTFAQRAYLQIILKNVVQLQAMIEDLLTVTQSREGKLNFDLQSVSVTDAIEDTMSTIRGAASNKQITVSAGDCSQLPPACADPIRLRQILIILLDNAVKFTPSGGSVTVSVSESEPGFLLFQVVDTGCGIVLEDRARVFEKLYQVTGPNLSDTSSMGRTGLGLGLHIARNLVAAQGGCIWVSGTSGQGSTFNFTLPIFMEASAEPASESHHRRRKSDLLSARLPSRIPAA